MMEQVWSMRNYVYTMHGKVVCPLCRINAGVDQYNFSGPNGGENQQLAWACMSCNSFVVGGVGATGAIPGTRATFGINSRSTPLP